MIRAFLLPILAGIAVVAAPRIAESKREGLPRVWHIAAIGTLLLAGVQIVAPWPAQSLSIRELWWLAAGCSLAVGLSGWRHLRGGARSSTLELILALLTVGVIGGAPSLLINTDAPLEAVSPDLFRLLVAGLAAASWIWALVVWHVRTFPATGTRATMRAAFPIACERLCLRCAVVASVAGIMLAVWPRVPGISVMDDTLGALGGGVGAFLLLTMAMLGARLATQRRVFEVFALVAAASLVGFTAERMLPFAHYVR
jgi:hypothetical protein